MVSPAYAADLAEAVQQIISYGKRQARIYLYCYEGVISWFEFVKEICAILENPCKINPISSAQYFTPPRRPAYSVLDTLKIQDAFGITSKSWRGSLFTCLSRLK